MADGAFFRHESGCYLTVNHPTTDPGKDGALWRRIIDSEDCFLPEVSKQNPIGTLVPTREEWESIATAIGQEKLNMRMFCRMVQKNITYKEGSLIYEAQIWVGEDLTGDDLEVMLQSLSTIYITATDATLEKEQRARELYRRVARFVKAMVIATTKVNIPPYILHGWRKPEGIATDVWWEHSGWLQVIHADGLVRIRLFHPDQFDKVSWESSEIGDAGRGAVNEKTIIAARRKHVSTHHERIMIDLENHDRRVRGEAPRPPQ
eukprot:1108411-Amphidinium_carterae.1